MKAMTISVKAGLWTLGTALVLLPGAYLVSDLWGFQADALLIGWLYGDHYYTKYLAQYRAQQAKEDA